MQSQTHRQTVPFSLRVARTQALGRWCSNVVAAVIFLFVVWHEYGPVRYRPPAAAGDWALAPDGRTIAFTAPRAIPTGLYTLDTVTKLVRQRSLVSAPLGPPRISRDGSWVAVALRAGDGRMGIWLEPLKGTRGGRWLYLDGNRWVRGYDWSADGTSLYVSDVPRGRVRQSARAGRFVQYRVATGQQRVIAVTRTDPEYISTGCAAANEEHLNVYGPIRASEYEATIYQLDPRSGTTAEPSAQHGWRCLHTADGKRALHMTDPSAPHSSMQWWITDEQGQTVVGPYAMGEEGWSEQHLLPDGRSVLVERSAVVGAVAAGSHRVERLHSDGGRELIFDDHLFDSPLTWQPPEACP